MRVLFFSPFARVIQHSIPEATLVRGFRRLGHNVDTISCGEAYRGQCITLSALGKSHGASEEFVGRTCRECGECSKKLFGNTSTVSQLFAAHQTRAESLEIDKVIAHVTPENFESFSFDNIPFGIICGYQHIIELKKTSSTITPNEWFIFRRELFHAMLTYFAMKEWIRLNPRQPDFVFVYNSFYGVNAVVRRVFENLGSRVISLHAGTNLYHFYDTIIMAEGDTIRHFTMLKEKWKNFENTPISDQDSRWIISHFKQLATGRSVFTYSLGTSGQVNLRERWHIPEHAKVVLVALSSHDERFAAEHVGALSKPKDAVFASQFDWILGMIEFARANPEYYIVFRIHPREFPNKREARMSEHALHLMEILQDLPPNAILNTPEDRVSLYDLAKVVDVLVTSWSSVAKELMVLGIPTVFYSNDLQLFAPDLGNTARTKQEYFDLILREARLGRRKAISERAIRWYAFEMRWSTVHFTTSLSPSASRFTKLFWRVIAKIRISLFLSWRIGQIKDPSTLLPLLYGTFFDEGTRLRRREESDRGLMKKTLYSIFSLLWDDRHVLDDQRFLG